jgi:K+-sensing histidine kinase KdpD
MTSYARPGREDRPDPIARAGSRQADSLAVRGTMRTYLGIAHGVGKTYAMLRDARARQRAGIDTVVAYWERHGRPATVAQRVSGCCDAGDWPRTTPAAPGSRS